MTVSESKQEKQKQTPEWVSELEQPEVQASLADLVRKMPEIQKTYQSLEDIVLFGQAFLQDRESIERLEEKITHYSINEETIKSLVTLIEKLPSIVRVVEQLEEITVFVNSVLKDTESMAYISGTIHEYIDPLVNEGEKGIKMLNEIKRRADSKKQSYSLFTIMKWLKDPTVQKGLGYMQATLEVLSEDKKQ